MGLWSNLETDVEQRSAIARGTMEQFMDGADAVGDVDPRTTACLTQKVVHIVRL